MSLFLICSKNWFEILGNYFKEPRTQKKFIPRFSNCLFHFSPNYLFISGNLFVFIYFFRNLPKNYSFQNPWEGMKYKIISWSYPGSQTTSEPSHLYSLPYVRTFVVLTFAEETKNFFVPQKYFLGNSMNTHSLNNTHTTLDVTRRQHILSELACTLQRHDM